MKGRDVVTFFEFLKKAKKKNYYGDSPEGDFVDDSFMYGSLIHAFEENHRFSEWREIERHIVMLHACEEAIKAGKAVFQDWKNRKKSRYVSQRQRFEIMIRDSHACQLCGQDRRDGVKLEIDHKIPVSKGGTNTLENLWTLCFNCNRGKSDSYTP